MFPSSVIPPVVLSIAGSDSSAGAGIQADLKSFAAHGVYGVCAVTAVVAEVPGSVAAIEPVTADTLRLQLDQLAGTFPLAAAKTGMLVGVPQLEMVCSFLKEHPRLPLVVDPVYRASAGKELLSDSAWDLAKLALFSRATLLTPNLAEAERLLLTRLTTEADLELAPRRIAETFGCAVLLKGGHVPGEAGDTIYDRAWIAGEGFTFPHPRLDIPDIHGTGCTLSAAIAARLALGQALPEAIARAIAYLGAALAQHHRWNGGRGAIPALNHFPDNVEFPPS
jgi:hydroxymethylpyrimidine kinase/phosphomethylpyrimidine kinase